MTPEEFATEIRNRIEALRSYNRPLNVAAASTHTEMTNRIFVDGGDAEGGKIGQYSTEDIWINPVKTATKNNKGFDPLTGKTGNTEFKTNPSRQRKTSYFKGWKGYRETQGLPVDTVNLNNTGDMFFDFAKSNLPFLERVTQINSSEYASTFTREINTKKASGNEDHFGKKIFELSDQENRNFYDTLELELRQALEI